MEERKVTFRYSYFDVNLALCILVSCFVRAEIPENSRIEMNLRHAIQL